MTPRPPIPPAPAARARPPGPVVSGPPPALIAALRRILRPLVRILVSFGVTFPSLAQLLKSLYVEVAEEHFGLADKPLTDSRITLLTGVHRKDVSRLRGRAPGGVLDDMTPTLDAQVVGRWLGLAAFQTAEGAPRPLPRTDKLARERGDPESFESLVSAISRDLRPRAVLDELIHAGMVTERADGLLDLARTAHLPRDDLDQMAFYLGRNLGDHAEAAAHNVTGGRPAFLERAVFHDGLSPQSVASLREEAERLGMVVLVSLNEKAHTLAEGDRGKPEAQERFTSGIYVYATDQPEPVGLDATPAPADASDPDAASENAEDPARQTTRRSPTPGHSSNREGRR